MQILQDAAEGLDALGAYYAERKQKQRGPCVLCGAQRSTSWRKHAMVTGTICNKCYCRTVRLAKLGPAGAVGAPAVPSQEQQGMAVGRGRHSRGTRSGSSDGSGSGDALGAAGGLASLESLLGSFLQGAADGDAPGSALAGARAGEQLMQASWLLPLLSVSAELQALDSAAALGPFRQQQQQHSRESPAFMQQPQQPAAAALLQLVGRQQAPQLQQQQRGFLPLHQQQPRQQHGGFCGPFAPDSDQQHAWAPDVAAGLQLPPPREASQRRAAGSAFQRPLTALAALAAMLAPAAGRAAASMVQLQEECWHAAAEAEESARSANLAWGRCQQQLPWDRQQPVAALPCMRLVLPGDRGVSHPVGALLLRVMLPGGRDGQLAAAVRLVVYGTAGILLEYWEGLPEEASWRLGSHSMLKHTCWRGGPLASSEGWELVFPGTAQHSSCELEIFKATLRVPLDHLTALACIPSGGGGGSCSSSSGAAGAGALLGPSLLQPLQQILRQTQRQLQLQGSAAQQQGEQQQQRQAATLATTIDRKPHAADFGLQHAMSLGAVPACHVAGLPAVASRDAHSSPPAGSGSRLSPPPQQQQPPLPQQLTALPSLPGRSAQSPEPQPQWQPASGDAQQQEQEAAVQPAVQLQQQQPGASEPAPPQQPPQQQEGMQGKGQQWPAPPTAGTADKTAPGQEAINPICCSSSGGATAADTARIPPATSAYVAADAPPPLPASALRSLLLAGLALPSVPGLLDGLPESYIGQASGQNSRQVSGQLQA